MCWLVVLPLLGQMELVHHRDNVGRGATSSFTVIDSTTETTDHGLDWQAHFDGDGGDICGEESENWFDSPLVVKSRGDCERLCERFGPKMNFSE